MSHEQPTAETMRPERMNYPHTAEGQMAFNGALIQWQHSAIEALTSELHSSKQIASRFANELRAATHKNTALQLAVDEMMKETERLRQELTMEQLAHLSTLGQLQERPAQPPAAAPYEAMFTAAVQSLAEISRALDIPDDVASVADGNAEILDAIESLKCGASTLPIVASGLYPTKPASDSVCSTCLGTGKIDETLGGEPFSNPHAPCPDCDGQVDADETPAAHFEGKQTLCPVCEHNYISGSEACDH